MHDIFIIKSLNALDWLNILNLAFYCLKQLFLIRPAGLSTQASQHD